MNFELRVIEEAHFLISVRVKYDAYIYTDYKILHNLLS